MNLSKQFLVALTLSTLLIGCAKQEKPKQNEKPHQEATHQHDQSIDEKAIEVTKQQTSIEGLSYTNAVAGASIPGQKVGAAYVTFFNDGEKDIEFVSVKSDVSNISEFHTMEMDGDNMIMRKMDKVIIPAKGEMLFRKGAEHIMLIELTGAVEEGQQVKLDITTVNGESFQLLLPVKNMSMAHNHSDMNHDEMGHEHHEEMNHEEHDHEEHSHKEHNHEEHNHDEIKQEK